MRRILADVDTGIDDMLALIYLAGLHKLGEVDLVGVSTTAGNTTVCNAAINSRYILDLCGLPEISVAAGPSKPLRVPLTTTPETHGEVGLGYVRPPRIDVGCSVPGQATQLWQEVLSVGQTHLLVTGPATMAASHLDLVQQASSVTIMGGAVDYPGNTTDYAEWNFWVDPDAARMVLDSVTPDQSVTLCHLGVTERILVDDSVIDTWNFHGELDRVVRDALRFYFEFHRSVGVGYCAQVHDLLAAMVAAGTVDICTVAKALTVDPTDRGAVVAGQGNTVNVLTGVDVEAVHAEARRAFAAVLTA